MASLLLYPLPIRKFFVAPSSRGFPLSNFGAAHPRRASLMIFDATSRRRSSVWD
jgi:hypothetical protein